ncbi:conserved hypothetical protein [Coccidioides posadasii str. Silveira]|uniref:Uncharacterized protein n=1 Tax=Coccidioides posadasii (strain RMSCC 757 / Silveira) TaxID=443226 RepID=E9D7K2_COCPS|nr:conserved hypothetical protein [Coccidioides posadasii str. Silveira]
MMSFQRLFSCCGCPVLREEDRCPHSMPERMPCSTKGEDIGRTRGPTQPRMTRQEATSGASRDPGTRVRMWAETMPQLSQKLQTELNESRRENKEETRHVCRWT